jgi:hypothetical protein
MLPVTERASERLFLRSQATAPLLNPDSSSHTPLSPLRWVQDESSVRPFGATRMLL